ncbi:MAG: hypothetical protein KAI73_10145 [Rhodospirillaceae bacterium]|nr:hypothetical protein [Rhodospirillaceae bacterium]
MKDAPLEAEAIEAALVGRFDDAVEIWKKTEFCQKNSRMGLFGIEDCGSLMQARLLLLAIVTRDVNYDEAAKKFGAWLETQMD